MSPDVTSITLRDGTICIADGAFNGLRSLVSVTIPRTVKYIGYLAFGGCESLTILIIPSSVTTIGRLAFKNCKSLTSVIIPSSVSTIGYGPFSGCDNLTNLVVGSVNETYDSRDNCNAIIETASNTLIGGCPATVIPGSVTAIGELAFWYTDSLKTVVIPGSVTSIGRQAFMYCGDLTSVTIPGSVVTIGHDAFTSCWALKDVYCYMTDLSNASVEYPFRVLGGFDYSGRTLHVLRGMGGAYRADENWYPYFGQIVEDLSMQGDVNSDGEVNIADVNEVTDMTLEAIYDAAGDVNGDGEVNIADINALIDMILE